MQGDVKDTVVTSSQQNIYININTIMVVTTTTTTSSSSNKQLNTALKFLSLPNACPLTIVALDAATGKPIAVNSTFESIFGPYYKFCEWEFAYAASSCSEDGYNNSSSSGGSGEKKVNDDNRSKFRMAINNVRNSLRHITTDDGSSNDNKDDDVEMEFALTHTTIRNVEMLTLGTNDAGLPIRKYFDWTIGSVRLDNDEEGEEEADGDSNGPSCAVILYGDMVNEIESSNR
jgi:hypothetical protein